MMDPTPVDPAHAQAVVPANDIFPDEKCLFLSHNNYELDPKIFVCHHPVIVEILKGHPLWRAFNATASVPEVYLQQFWDTLKLNVTVKPNVLEAKIANKDVTLTRAELRTLLGLPLPTHYEGKRVYDSFCSDEEVCADLISLGYHGKLATVTQFKRMLLPNPWSTLFMIVNKCLSPKHTGFDKCNTNIMDLFHGIAMHKHFNYISIIWMEIRDQLRVKEKPKIKQTFIPFMRFFSIIIDHFLTKFPEIPTRPQDEYVTPPTLKYMKKDKANECRLMRIPEVLLAFADQNSPAVIKYRLANPLMGQPQSGDPAQGGQVRASEGLVNEGEQGGNGEGENEGGDKSDDSSDSPSDSDGDGDGDAPQALLALRQSKIKYKVSALKKDSLVEKDKALRKRKPMATSRSKKKPNIKGATTSTPNIWVSPISTSVNMFTTGLEVTVNPTLQAEPHQSHSFVSRHIDVSFPLGDIAHNLSPSRSEVGVIEASGSLTHSTTSSLTPTSLVSTPLNVLSVSRTHTPVESIAGLSDQAGTPVVPPSTGALRGSGGSPARVNITPALKVGHQTDATSVTVSTGILSGPGVTIPPVSRIAAKPRHSLRSSLAKLKPAHIQGTGSTNTRAPMDKGKAHMNEEPSEPKSPPREIIELPPEKPTHPQPRTCQPSNIYAMPLDEVQSILLARMLLERPITALDNPDPVTVLKQHEQPLQPQNATVTLQQQLTEMGFNLQKQISSVETSLQNSIKDLEDRVDQALNKVSNAMIGMGRNIKYQFKNHSLDEFHFSLKPRHYDPDDASDHTIFKPRHDDPDEALDHHEGEKGQQTIPSATATQTQPSEPTQSTQSETRQRSTGRKRVS